MRVYYWSNVNGRDYQQDCFNIFMNLDHNNEAIDSNYPPINAFMIADGHGKSEKVATEAVKFFTNSFCLTKQKFPLSQKTIEERFSLFHDILKNSNYAVKSGSTFIILFLYVTETVKAKKNLKYQAINLGDCRLISFDVSGSYRQITGDHKFTSFSERIRCESTTNVLQEGEQNHKVFEIEMDTNIARLDGLSVSRTFGDMFSLDHRQRIEKNGEESEDEGSDDGYADVEIHEYLNYQPDIFGTETVDSLATPSYKFASTYFVLGSDGLYDCMQNSEIANFILETTNPKMERYYEYKNTERPPLTDIKYGIDSKTLGDREEPFSFYPIKKKNGHKQVFINELVALDDKEDKKNVARKLCLEAASRVKFIKNENGEIETIPNLDNITCIVIHFDGKKK